MNERNERIYRWFVRSLLGLAGITFVLFIIFAGRAANSQENTIEIVPMEIICDHPAKIIAHLKEHKFDMVIGGHNMITMGMDDGTVTHDRVRVGVFVAADGQTSVVTFFTSRPMACISAEFFVEPEDNPHPAAKGDPA